MEHWRQGTRFRLYPQAHEGYVEPEIVWLSPLPGTVGPGPADGRMHVIDALDKLGPYDPPRWQPPFDGRIGPPAMPQRDGHFDRLPASDRGFLSAHLYGSARRVLDVWEALLKRRITWWHAASYPSLELIPLVRWDNAQSGGGFVEMGARRNDRGELQLFCLNFEIIGHEVGHAIIFSEIGTPNPGRLTGEYLAFQESFADLIALISVLFFDSFVSRLLAQTHGNLYTLNMLSRIGELSQTQQIRIADNLTRMRDLRGLHFVDGGWVDATGAGRNAHDLAQPLTGAIFDTLIEIFQDRLVARGVIPPDADARGWTRDEVAAAMGSFEARWGHAFVRFEPTFRAALLEARDVVGRALALVLDRIDANSLSFERVASLFLRACLELGQAHHLGAIRENFLERDIAVESSLDAAPPHRLRALAPRPIPRSGACLAERVAALRRARKLAARAGIAQGRERGAAVLVNQLLRRDHRQPIGRES